MKVHVMDYHPARAGYLAAVLKRLGVPEVTTLRTLTGKLTVDYAVFIYDGIDSSYEKYLNAIASNSSHARFNDGYWMDVAYQIVRVREPQMSMPENLFIVDISDIWHADYNVATQHLSDYAEELVPTLMLQHIKG